MPGRVIAIPESPQQLRVEDVDLDGIRRSFLRRALTERRPSADELVFLAAELNAGAETVERWVAELDEPRPAAVGA